VICTDLKMPGLDGLGLVRRVMAEMPTPIIVVSGALGEGKRQAQDSVFELINAGAIEVSGKPRGGFANGDSPQYQALARKLRIAAGVSVFRRSPKQAPDQTQPRPRARIRVPAPRAPVKLIVVGASTGGPAALLKLLSALPSDLPVPVVAVQHIAAGFIDGLAHWLGTSSQFPVKIADDGMLAQPGVCVFAPDEHHLLVNAHRRLHLSDAPPNGGGHRPSIDVLFESAAAAFGAATIAVLLTGMGRDGANGMGAIRRAGGLAIAQDKAGCTVFGMPAAAIAQGNADAVVPLAEIGPAILNCLNQRPPSAATSN